MSAQCTPHNAAAHAASRDPEARYAFDGTVARESFITAAGYSTVTQIGEDQAMLPSTWITRT